MNTPNFKVTAKTGGSKFDKNNPIVKCEWLFKETNDPKFVFEAVNINFLNINYDMISIWNVIKEWNGMMVLHLI